MRASVNQCAGRGNSTLYFGYYSLAQGKQVRLRKERKAQIQQGKESAREEAPKLLLCRAGRTDTEHLTQYMPCLLEQVEEIMHSKANPPLSKN